jgi:hypothetical protein
MQSQTTIQWTDEALESLTRLSVELIYDSSCDRRPMGVRSGQTSTRHVLYRAGGVLVDLRFDTDAASSKEVVVGQVADRRKPAEPAAEIPVLLMQDERVVSQVVSNGFGEFHAAYEAREGMSLGVVLGDEWLLQLPLDRGGSSGDGHPAGL